RVLHERVLLIASTSSDAPRVPPEQRVKLVPVGVGMTRLIFHFGVMETPNIMEGLRLACREGELSGIDPQSITYYFSPLLVAPTPHPPRNGHVEKAPVRNHASDPHPAGRVFRGAARAGRSARRGSRDLIGTDARRPVTITMRKRIVRSFAKRGIVPPLHGMAP